MLLTRVVRAALAGVGCAAETALRLLSEAVPAARAVDRDEAIIAAPNADARVSDGRPEPPTSTEISETVRFALDGQAYEINLDPESAEALRVAFKPYVAAGRPVEHQPPRDREQDRHARSVPTDHRDDAASIREWARAHGHHVSGRGPIPARIRDAYRAAR